MDTFKGKVRLVVKNNPYKYRDYSHIAAEASLAAADQGKYWEMHDLLLKNSPKLDRNSLINYAKELGLDVNKFTDSIDKMRHSSLIEQDKKLALSLDLYNTPTFFINGRPLVGAQPLAEFQALIDTLLKQRPPSS